MRHPARADWNEVIPGPRKDFRVDVDRQDKHRVAAGAASEKKISVKPKETRLR
jgi:hypothetical protein